MRSGMAPHSPWLVKTQTWNSIVLRQDVFTSGPQRFLTLSQLFMCHTNAQTDTLSKQDKHVQTSRHMHKSSSCLSYKKNPLNVVFFVNNTAVNLKRDQFFLRRMQPHGDLDLAHTHTHTTVCFQAIWAKMPSNSIWEIVVWLIQKSMFRLKGRQIFVLCNYIQSQWKDQKSMWN